MGTHLGGPPTCVGTHQCEHPPVWAPTSVGVQLKAWFTCECMKPGFFIWEVKAFVGHQTFSYGGNKLFKGLRLKPDSTQLHPDPAMFILLVLVSVSLDSPNHDDALLPTRTLQTPCSAQLSYLGVPVAPGPPMIFLTETRPRCWMVRSPYWAGNGKPECSLHHQRYLS